MLAVLGGAARGRGWLACYPRAGFRSSVSATCGRRPCHSGLHSAPRRAVQVGIAIAMGARLAAGGGGAGSDRTTGGGGGSPSVEASEKTPNGNVGSVVPASAPHLEGLLFASFEGEGRTEVLWLATPQRQHLPEFACTPTTVRTVVLSGGVGCSPPRTPPQQSVRATPPQQQSGCGPGAHMARHSLTMACSQQDGKRHIEYSTGTRHDGATVPG